VYLKIENTSPPVRFTHVCEARLVSLIAASCMVASHVCLIAAVRAACVVYAACRMLYGAGSIMAGSFVRCTCTCACCLLCTACVACCLVMLHAATCAARMSRAHLHRCRLPAVPPRVPRRKARGRRAVSLAWPGLAWPGLAWPGLAHKSTEGYSEGSVSVVPNHAAPSTASTVRGERRSTATAQPTLHGTTAAHALGSRAHSGAFVRKPPHALPHAGSRR
jgi:hypothetical protein